MTRDELLKRIQGYEWMDFECKKAQRDVPNDAYSTVSAFANTQGGWLLFGVSEANGLRCKALQLKSALSRADLQEALGLADREHFSKEYLQPALNSGLIEMTLPDKPRSSKQQYRLTNAGKHFLASMK